MGGASVPHQSLQGALKAVDLTSESSSVLGNLRSGGGGGGGALRKLSTSSSVSRSSTSSQNKYVSDLSRPSTGDYDSGHHSMYDSHSQSSGSSSQQPSPATTQANNAAFIASASGLNNPTNFGMGGHANSAATTAKYTSRIHG